MTKAKKIDIGLNVKREAHTPSELRVRDTGEGESSGRVIEGYAILFDTPSAPLYDDGEEELREIIGREAVTQELLDSSDIKFTMFHDRQLLLARSKQGSGTLGYTIDERGVAFSFEAPRTPDGDKALELVRSGIIDGCSFAFSTRYYDRNYVERKVERKGDKTVVTCRVKVMTGVYDMTITPDPAYPATSVEARDLSAGLREEGLRDLGEYIRTMREASRHKI